MTEEQPSSAEPEPAPEPAVMEAPKPPSIGEPGKSYGAPATGGSVWGSVSKDPSLSSAATEFVPPAGVQVAPKQQQPSHTAQTSPPVVPSVGRPTDFAGPSASGTPYSIGAPQTQQTYGSTSGLYGGGFVQSLSA